MLRPRPARWFEILSARDDATLVLEALARTGAVELDARPGAGLPADPEAVLPLLAQFAALETRYAAYWPPASACLPSPFPDTPAHALQQALQRLQAWAQDAEPPIRTLQRAEAETAELQLWARVLAARAGSPLPAHELAAAGPLVQVRLFVLPAGSDVAATLAATTAAAHTLASVCFIDHAPHLLVAGTPAALQALAQRVSTLKGSSHELPRWLRDPATDPTVHLPQRLRRLARLHAGALLALQALQARHGLPQALGDVHRLQWLLDNVHALEAGTLLCWVTGWCSDDSGRALAHALQASGARALLRQAPPPADLPAPLLLHNPPWARPFEIFSRALGMPASNEADPSVLLALAVPLMFGYMFGDIGQGLVLAAGGWALRRRFAVARLLMVGGLAAAAFGFVFGSCFGLHGLPWLPPALWLHPLDAPLAVLMAPLAGGALLLLLGLGLDALSAFWRGEMLRWLRTEAGLVLVYLGLLAAFVEPAGFDIAAAGALAWCAGHAVQARRATAALGALGELVEKTLQILINTLSFARVGAFALAHAGLSSALVALMAAADNPLAKALVLVLGNVVVIVLEAMVVSIQTTRLVLFEFFTRFMQGRGRVFRPLPPPPYTAQEV
ncbi:MAG: hypothetical protein Q8K45_17910 [Rubrivivax sp.]|nr:hypothetical protein [Rubrivivax sp.]